MLNEVYAGEGDLHEGLIGLALLQGTAGMQLPDSIAGSLHLNKREFDLPMLIAMAQDNRANLQAALKYQEVSHNNLRLAKANRFIDLGLSVGGSYASEVRNEIAPAPAFRGITAGISIPLKFSNTNKGELRAAQSAVAQSERQYEAVELQISGEVAQAYYKYQFACRQAEQFDAGVLDDAEAILQKKVYGYTRGETNILEVLNAQRTYNEVQTSFYEALYNCSEALVELERACGMWDIEM